MRQLEGHSLWLGHAGDLRKVASLEDAGIVAVVDLAINEPPAILPREIAYCRFPIVDGGDNPPWHVRCAAEAVAGFLRVDAPTLVCCSAGLSRSPCIAAAGLHLATGRSLDDCLALATAGRPADVSPALWHEVRQLMLN